MMNGVTAVLLAGGRGARMGAQVPKQELELDGRKIYRIAAERFASFTIVDAIMFVCPAERLDAYKAGLAGIPKVRWVIAGGAERHDSVWNALEALRNDPPAVVLMHDAVRPFVSGRTVAEVARVAAEHGAATAAARAVDTLYEVRDGIVAGIPDRRTMWHAQTPQGFRYDILRRAHEEFRKKGGATTDDTRLVQAIGQMVRVVEEPLTNLKITGPADIAIATALYRELKE